MLKEWSSFFAMTGSAGATLVGLLFVVVTLGNGLTLWVGLCHSDGLLSDR